MLFVSLLLFILVNKGYQLGNSVGVYTNVLKTCSSPLAAVG